MFNIITRFFILINNHNADSILKDDNQNNCKFFF